MIQATIPDYIYGKVLQINHSNWHPTLEGWLGWLAGCWEDPMGWSQKADSIFTRNPLISWDSPCLGKGEAFDYQTGDEQREQGRKIRSHRDYIKHDVVKGIQLKVFPPKGPPLHSRDQCYYKSAELFSWIFLFFYGDQVFYEKRMCIEYLAGIIITSRGWEQ